MSMTDPIANMLNMIRNANRRRLPSLDVPASKLLQAILQIFKDSGYIDNFRLIEDKKQGTLRVYLKFVNKTKPAITNLKRVSRPGLRIYAKKGKVPQVLHGLGTALISTSKGILTDKQAREQDVGGEVLCFIW
jgi:small subunit ribosomal protein S8